MKEKIKEWFRKIFQKKHNDAVIKDRISPTHSQDMQNKLEPIDDPDYRYLDFRDEILDVEKVRRLKDGQ